MTRYALVFALLAAPAAAQTHEPPAAEAPTPDAFQQGLESFMGNLLSRAQPSLDRLGQDLGGLAQQLAPVLGEVGNLMDDARNYQAPERLANGDILIRRRADAPPAPPIGPNLRQMIRPTPDTTPDASPDTAPQPPDAPERGEEPPKADPASGPELEL